MGDSRIRKALDDYKSVYMPYRNFAVRTREEYQNDLENFVEFVEKSGINLVRELGLPIIEQYVAKLEQDGLTSLTRKRKVVSIRSFLGFLYHDGYIGTNIAKKVILPFTENTTPAVLTKTECDRLRTACAEEPRDRAIIELILQTGITLSELVHLVFDDIQLMENDRGFLRIKASRGKKERIIPLNTKACIAIKSYLGAREKAEKSVLFLNRFGQSLGESGAQKMLKRYLIKAARKFPSCRTCGSQMTLVSLPKFMPGEVVNYLDKHSLPTFVASRFICPKGHYQLWYVSRFGNTESPFFLKEQL